MASHGVAKQSPALELRLLRVLRALAMTPVSGS